MSKCKCSEPCRSLEEANQEETSWCFDDQLFLKIKVNRLFLTLPSPCLSVCSKSRPFPSGPLTFLTPQVVTSPRPPLSLSLSVLSTQLCAKPGYLQEVRLHWSWQDNSLIHTNWTLKAWQELAGCIFYPRTWPMARLLKIMHYNAPFRWQMLTLVPYLEPNLLWSTKTSSQSIYQSALLFGKPH